MSDTELGLITLAVPVLLIYLLVIGVRRWFSRDEMFVGIIPGQIPAAGQEVPTERLRSREYRGPVAVQFHPPQHLRPGLVGTIVDGTADMRDVTATIVDLAVRGYCTIKALGEGDSKKKDWEITAQQVTHDMMDDLDSTERVLLHGMFTKGPVVRMSELTANYGPALRQAQQDLYNRTVQVGWYDKHPRKAGRVGCWAVLLLFAAIVLGALFAFIGLDEPLKVIGIVSAVILVLGPALYLSPVGRSRVPRTALGTAARIQALGFRDYLATAEADQIRFEEAAGLFSRYLPYAIVFGVADHWAKIFGDVAARAKMNDIEMPLGDLAWFTLEVVDNMIWFDILSGGGVGDLMSMVDIGDIAAGLGEGVGEFVGGVGGFVESLDGLSAIGDGCDGCDLDF